MVQHVITRFRNDGGEVHGDGVNIAARQTITETWWRERRTDFELYISTLVEAVVEARGFVCPILCSPEELGVDI